MWTMLELCKAFNWMFVLLCIIIGGIVNNTLRPLIPSWSDPSWKQLMERCWAADPADRPSFAMISSELRAIAAAIDIK